MKTIKTLVLLFFSSILCFISGNAYAQVSAPAVKKEHARRSIQKTAFVIKKAQMKVKEGKVYTGNLARAISHQKHAKQLYLDGNYRRAIYFSRRAKTLAILAIKANQGTETADMADSKEEATIMKDAPSDEQLDLEISRALPSESQKDEDVVSVDLNEISLKDNQ